MARDRIFGAKNFINNWWAVVIGSLPLLPYIPAYS